MTKMMMTAFVGDGVSGGLQTTYQNVECKKRNRFCGGGWMGRQSRISF